MKLIGFTGYRRAGKDTAAQVFLERGYVNVRFAGALKEMLRAHLAYIGVGPDTIEELLEGKLKEREGSPIGGRSMRYVMQTLGTEWGRNLISDTIWMDAFRTRVGQFDRIVCTDVRFLNEAKLIRELGGRIVRVVRPGLEKMNHPSEQEIDSIPADYIITNAGSREQARTAAEGLFDDLDSH